MNKDYVYEITEKNGGVSLTHLFYNSPCFNKKILEKPEIKQLRREIVEKLRLWIFRKGNNFTNAAAETKSELEKMLIKYRIMSYPTTACESFILSDTEKTATNCYHKGVIKIRPLDSKWAPKIPGLFESIEVVADLDFKIPETMEIQWRPEGRY